jgi:hypothetical protein
MAFHNYRAFGGGLQKSLSGKARTLNTPPTTKGAPLRRALKKKGFKVLSREAFLFDLAL